MFRNDNCPCTRECPDRDPYCHCTCPKYKEWAAKKDAAKKAAAIKSAGRCMTDGQKKALWKSYRRDNYGRCTKKFSS